MKLLFKPILLFCLATSLNAQAPMDTLVMTNGEQIFVRVTDTDKKLIYFKKDGKQKQVPSKAIAEIKYGVKSALIIDEEERKVYVKEIIPVKGYSKKELYLIAKEWMIDAFRDSKEVIELEDKEAGKIIGKGSAEITGFLSAMNGTTEYMRFTIRIYTKNEKVKFVIDNIINHNSTVSHPIETMFWTNTGKKRNVGKNVKRRIERVCKDTLISFLEAFNKQKLEEDDDW